MADDPVIADSRMDFPEAVAGTAAPGEILAALTLLDVRYAGFDGRLHTGQIVVHREVAGELAEIFTRIEALKFPVAQVVPVVRYAWSDEASMAANNSSAFNYRLVEGTKRLSLHAAGRAVDINPWLNPVFYPDGRSAPAGALWRPGSPGTFADGHPVVLAFLERGWRWGGHFAHVLDYHHFDKQVIGEGP